MLDVLLPQEPPNLAETMKELSYLGSLLGMPDIYDPTFALAYTAFFGDAPPMPGISLDDVAMEEDESKQHTDMPCSEAIHTDNVS